MEIAGEKKKKKNAIKFKNTALKPTAVGFISQC